MIFILKYDYQSLSEYIVNEEFNILNLTVEAQSIILRAALELADKEQYGDVLNFLYLSNQLKNSLLAIKKAEEQGVPIPSNSREFVELSKYTKDVFGDLESLIAKGTIALNKDKIIYKPDQISSNLSKEDIEIIRGIEDILEEFREKEEKDE